jgi:hypothetical protein
MAKRTISARHAALPETRREYDDPVVAIGKQIAETIAALERSENPQDNEA